MDYYNNPYSPGAGTRPPALTGRDKEIADFEILLRRLEGGLSEQPPVLYGLRGVGKTVLINKLEDIAREHGWGAVAHEFRSDIDFRATISRLTHKATGQLRKRGKAIDRIKRLMQVQLAFSLRADTTGLTAAGFDVKPAIGTADSGDIEMDLVELFIELGTAAKAANTGIVFLFDELQLLGQRDLEALIAALHRIGQKALPVSAVAAGLPTLPGRLAEAKSYSERLFSFHRLGPLSDCAARNALTIPAEAAGVKFKPDALIPILTHSEGYPYFLQEWGKAVWNTAVDNPITLQDVELATPIVQRELDEEFFAVRLERATTTEQRYLIAMAQLGDGPLGTRAVAEQMNYPTTSASPIRHSLIEKGLIYSESYGTVAFTVPHFADFLRRQ